MFSLSWIEPISTLSPRHNSFSSLSRWVRVTSKLRSDAAVARVMTGETQEATRKFPWDSKMLSLAQPTIAVVKKIPPPSTPGFGCRSQSRLSP